MIGYNMGFFIGQGSHYCQDFSGGVLQAWMKENMNVDMTTLLARGVMWESSFWAT